MRPGRRQLSRSKANSGDKPGTLAAVSIDGAAGRITLIELEPSPGGKLTASIPAAITGAGQAGFRAQYLRDLAAAGPIRVELTGTVEPARILSEDPAFLGVLMPMRVK